VLVGVEGGDDAVQRKQRKAAPGDDPVQLPLHERLRLRDDDDSTGGLPCLLLLLSILLDAIGIILGRGNPVGYGWPRAPAALLIGLGR
jgi:hypothetical protein